MLWPRLKRPREIPPALVTYDIGTRTGIACWIQGVLQGATTLDWDQVPDFARSCPSAVHVIEFPDHIRTVGTDIVINSARAGEIKGITDGLRLPVKQWKGNASKDVTEQWGRAALSPAELALTKGISNHAWDAIVQGLYYLKRI